MPALIGMKRFDTPTHTLVTPGDDADLPRDLAAVNLDLDPAPRVPVAWEDDDEEKVDDPLDDEEDLDLGDEDEDFFDDDEEDDDVEGEEEDVAEEE